jgi:hypothetical protein
MLVIAKFTMSTFIRSNTEKIALKKRERIQNQALAK